MTGQRRDSNRRRVDDKALGLILLASAISSPALAQDGAGTAASAAPRDDTISEVVVTALRHTTTLQSTPLSVAALGGEVLQEKGVKDLIDVASSVPGFTLRDNGPGQRRPVIRGIQGAGEAQVGTYYDEFPITSSPGATNDAGRFAPDIKLVDIDRVEILRGPQGTLFGGGSMGGTLRIVTAKPNLSNWSGSVASQVGFVSHGGSELSADGAVNIPLVEDRVAVRVVGYAGRADGFIDNVALDQKNINRSDYAGGRVSVRIAPTENLTIDLFGLLQRYHTDAGYASIRSLGDLKSNLPAYDPLTDKVQIYGVTAQYDAPLATFVGNISHYRRDLDFSFLFPNLAIPRTSPAVLGTGIVQQPEESRTDTYELRAQSPTSASPLFWTVGVFKQKREALTRSIVPFAAANGRPSATLPLFQDRSIKSALNQTAVFGEVSYTLWDKLTATVGLRWFEYDVSSLQAAVIASGGVTPANPGVYSGATPFKQSDTTTKFGLSYKVDRDLMVYVQRSEGFRPGGANQTVSPLIPPGFGSDSVVSYEIGVKSQWFDRRLTLNADYYHLIWDNMQVAGSTPDGLFRFTTNAGQAKVDGVEVELSARPIDSLELGLTYGYVDARLTADQPFIRGVPRHGLSGDKIPAVPENSLNFSVEKSFDVSDALIIRLRGEAQYVSGSQNNFHPTLTNTTTGADTAAPDPFFAKWDGFTTYDARLTFDFDKYTVQLFARNLTDKRGVNFVFVDNFRPAGYTYVIKPRTIGVSVAAKF